MRASAVPGVLDACRSTQATAGTAGATTITQIRGPTRTVQGTAGFNYSAEPTVLTVVKSWYVPQYNGMLILQFPLGREPEQTASANAQAIRQLLQPRIVQGAAGPTDDDEILAAKTLLEPPVLRSLRIMRGQPVVHVINVAANRRAHRENRRRKQYQ